MHVMWISGRVHSVMEVCRDIKAVLMQQLPQTEQILAFTQEAVGIMILDECHYALWIRIEIVVAEHVVETGRGS